MKKFKFIKYLFIISIVILLTGCKQDDMEDIDIVVTNYANEYIISELYGNHSTIESIYPDGINISDYKVTTKQKKDVSKAGLFIYNGLVPDERTLAVSLLDINSNLKIIDTAYVLEEEYSPVELWLNPSSLLMMAKNVQMGLNEYVTSSYLKQEINDKYDALKVTLSELDADYRVAVNDAKNKTIVVNDESLKYLEKFGLTVISLDSEATDKTIAEVEDMIDNGDISYIFTFKGDELSENSKNIIEEYPNVKQADLHRIDNLTDKERQDKVSYIDLMNYNLSQLKQELYQ